MKPPLHNRESGIPPLRHVACPHLSLPSISQSSFAHILSRIFFPSCPPKMHTWNQQNRERAQKPRERWRQKLRAACPLRVGNDIMTGLQCLVGGSFYSSCQDQCAIVHADWMSVCMHVHVPSISCDGKLTRGFWGPKRDVESRERWHGRKGCAGGGEKGKTNREVSLRKKKKI